MKTIQVIFLSNFKQFYNSDFPFLYIHEIFVKYLLKQKILYLKQFK